MLLLVGTLEKKACSRPDKGVLGWFDLEAMEPTGISLPAHGAMKVRVAKSMLVSSTKCLKGEIRAETKRATSTWGSCEGRLWVYEAGHCVQVHTLLVISDGSVILYVIRSQAMDWVVEGCVHVCTTEGLGNVERVFGNVRGDGYLK